MERNETKRTKWLTVRMNEEEYKALEALHRQSTCSSLSEYARRIVLGKPIILRYHNLSLDDFMTGMLQLRGELKTISGNFNQAVRRANTLRHLPDIQQWILLNEQDKTRLTKQIETISTNIEKAYQLWSRV
ncbi:plasmid mobilization protein [Puia sp. P3]|uniref:plasmid mobilization protein n=1 Tax=Puia sp. P3 TaxID=3423952 RepID=UPI003D6675AB